MSKHCSHMIMMFMLMLTVVGCARHLETTTWTVVESLPKNYQGDHGYMMALVKQSKDPHTFCRTEHLPVDFNEKNRCGYYFASSNDRGVTGHIIEFKIAGEASSKSISIPKSVRGYGEFHYHRSVLRPGHQYVLIPVNPGEYSPVGTTSDIQGTFLSHLPRYRVGKGQIVYVGTFSGASNTLLEGRFTPSLVKADIAEIGDDDWQSRMIYSNPKTTIAECKLQTSVFLKTHNICTYRLSDERFAGFQYD